MCLNGLYGHDSHDPIQVCAYEYVRIAPEEFEGKDVEWYNEEQELLHKGNVLEYKAIHSEGITAKVFPETGDAEIHEFQINVIASPGEFHAGESTEICKGEFVVLGPGPDDNADSYTYHWSPEHGLDDPFKRNPKANPSETIEYKLTVTDKNSGCKSYSSVLIKVKGAIIDPGEGRGICKGDHTTLGGHPTAKGIEQEFTYDWSPAESLNDPSSPNPVAKPGHSTKYMLIVKSEGCPADTAYVSVVVNHPLTFKEVKSHTINAGESIVLSVPGGVSYNWSPSTGLDNDNIKTPTASPLVSTTYKVELIDENGCPAETEVEVIVKYGFFIPNLFSPNNDGQNDAFRGYGYGISRLVLQVFNRSGQLLYESANTSNALENGWDGKFNGQDQPNGTYIWSISGEFHDGSPIEFEGKNSGKLTLVK